MRRVAADFGPIPEYAGESLDRVAKLTEADYPLDGKDFTFRTELGGRGHDFGLVHPKSLLANDESRGRGRKRSRTRRTATSWGALVRSGKTFDLFELSIHPTQFRARFKLSVISFVQRFPNAVRDEIDTLLPWQNCLKLWKKNKNLFYINFECFIGGLGTLNVQKKCFPTDMLSYPILFTHNGSITVQTNTTVIDCEQLQSVFHGLKMRQSNMFRLIYCYYTEKGILVWFSI